MTRTAKPFPKLVKIYKIEYTDDPKIFYVGSTSERLLKTRLTKHRYDANQRPHLSKLFTFMNEKGIDNFKIVLIEEKLCQSLDEQLMYEEAYIKELKPSLNQRPARTTKEERRWRDNNTRQKLRQQNMDTERYYCLDCDRSFDDKTKLKRHCESQLHLKKSIATFSEENKTTKKYYCEDCDASFSYFGNITHYASYHHLNKQLPFSTKEYDYCCEICDHIFSSKGDLKRHLQSDRHRHKVNS